MIKKISSLLSLEKKILDAVGSRLAQFERDISIRLSMFEKRIAAGSTQLDKLEASMNSRLSRLEVLFADELSAKENARDLVVRKKRLGK